MKETREKKMKQQIQMLQSDRYAQGNVEWPRKALIPIRRTIKAEVKGSFSMAVNVIRDKMNQIFLLYFIYNAHCAYKHTQNTRIHQYT